jgi:hypothetical protein
MKKHKLAKNALKHPELFAPAELAYFQMWLRARKERKERKEEKSLQNVTDAMIIEQLDL